VVNIKVYQIMCITFNREGSKTVQHKFIQVSISAKIIMLRYVVEARWEGGVCGFSFQLLWWWELLEDTPIFQSETGTLNSPRMTRKL
jgi:hypothetical protein